MFNFPARDDSMDLDCENLEAVRGVVEEKESPMLSCKILLSMATVETARRSLSRDFSLYEQSLGEKLAWCSSSDRFSTKRPAPPSSSSVFSSR